MRISTSVCIEELSIRLKVRSQYAKAAFSEVHALSNGDPESGAIRVNDLPEWLRPAVEPTAEAEITPERFFRALDQAQQNRTKAARILGMSRAQFYRLMKKFAGK